MHSTHRGNDLEIAPLVGKFTFIVFKHYLLCFTVFVLFSSLLNKSHAQSEADNGIEIVVAEVTVNGLMYGTSIIAIDVDGMLYAREESLVAWNIQRPFPGPIQINDQEFFPISTLGDYTSELDTTTYQLNIELGTGSFRNQVFDFGSKTSSYEPSSDMGLFVDYDVNLQHDTLLGDQSGILLKPVFFSSLGHWVSRVAWQSNTVIEGQESLVFLENYFRHDNPEKQTTLIIGDSITPSGSLGRALSFTGVQYGRNFALTPGEITFPLPSIKGEALIPSTVDLFVNQNKVANNEANPGLFEIRDIPIVNGAGELQLVVTDALGRQTVINSDFYASTDLLRKGLSAYSINAGVLRNNLGLESFSYGERIGVVDYKYGLNDKVTLSAKLESDSNRNNLGIGTAVNLWHKGILNAAVAISNQDNASIARIGYQYSNLRYRINVGYQYADEDYGFVGSGTIIKPPKQQLNLNAGMHFSGVGSLGVSYINQSFYSREGFKVVSLNFQKNIKRIFNLSAYVSKVSGNSSDDLSFGITVSRSLGGNKSYNVSYSEAADYNTVRAQYNKYAPYGEGTGYMISVADNTFSKGEVEASWIRRNRQYSVDLEARNRNSETGLSTSLNGSFSMLAGKFEFSREVQNAFALVKVSDIPDVRIYLENQLVGKTDADGVLLVPGLRPYDVNKLNISISDLPIQTHIAEYTKTVSPYQNSGSIVTFDVSIMKNYQFIAMQSATEIIDEGSLIYLSDPEIDSNAEEISITGYNGLVFLDLGKGNYTLYIKSGEEICTIDVGTLNEYKLFSPSEEMEKVICQPAN